MSRVVRSHEWALPVRWTAMVVLAIGALSLPSCRANDESIGARVIPQDAIRDIRRVDAPFGTRDMLASPVYTITPVQEPLSRPVELRLKSADARWIVYWDEELQRWIPVETKRDGDELVAQVDHLSLWSTIREEADWLDTRVRRLIGTRTQPPICTGQPPRWVTSFEAEPGDHPRLFACHGADEKENELALVTLRNNRGYPLWVTFTEGTRPVELKRADYELVSSFEGLVRLGFGSVLGEGRIYLDSLKQLSAFIAQPESTSKTGTVEVHATLDAALVGFHVVLEVLSSQGLVDIPMSDGKLLGVVAFECYAKVPWASIGLFDRDRLVGALQELRGCLEESVRGDVQRLEALGTNPSDATLKRLKSVSRVLLALRLTSWFQQMADAVLLDKPLVDRQMPVAYLGFAAKASPIASVDWKNIRYEVECPGIAAHPFEVQLRDGVAEVPPSGDLEGFEVGVEATHIGELTGDDRPEAAILLVCHPSGASPNLFTTEVQVFGDGPERIARVSPPGRYRSDNNFDPRFNGDPFLMRELTLLTGVDYWVGVDAHCCPSVHETVNWRWNGERLVPEAPQRPPAATAVKVGTGFVASFRKDAPLNSNEAVALLAKTLGAPSEDSGWGPGCVGESRSVRWGAFSVAFQREARKETLLYWGLDPSRDGRLPRAVSVDGPIGLGSTARDVKQKLRDVELRKDYSAGDLWLSPSGLGGMLNEPPESPKSVVTAIGWEYPWLGC